MTKEQLVEAILKLSEEDREDIFEALLSKIEHPPAPKDEGYAALVQRRIEDIDQGRVKTVPWSEARKQLLEKCERPTQSS